jgi:hypothetical protein
MCPIARSPIIILRIRVSDRVDIIRACFVQFEKFGSDISSSRDSFGCPILEILDNLSILECATG